MNFIKVISMSLLTFLLAGCFSGESTELRPIPKPYISKNPNHKLTLKNKFMISYIYSTYHRYMVTENVLLALEKMPVDPNFKNYIDNSERLYMCKAIEFRGAYIPYFHYMFMINRKDRYKERDEIAIGLNKNNVNEILYFGNRSMYIKDDGSYSYFHHDWHNNKLGIVRYSCKIVPNTIF